MKILVTGAAGFIGFHLCRRLVNEGHEVIGIDNINDYYDVDLKYARLEELGIKRDEAKVFLSECLSTYYGAQMTFIRVNLEDEENIPKLFEKSGFEIVCNLAAQAGVRYSIENPKAYIDSNINGFLNVLECCRHNNVRRLVYASSSSVYGNTLEVPFKESNNVDFPISLYAATKKSNELMAHTYSHLYNLETIGLRFFTVYGPWGRPDMAMFLFAEAILNDKSIKVFNNGDLSRDFTYIDDIINGVMKTLIQDSRNNSLYKLYNIGNSTPVQLIDFINAIEKVTEKRAIKKMMPMQAGDVNRTWADIEKMKNDYDYSPSVSVDKGVQEFINWYQLHYSEQNKSINK